ncbi:hypothetical protein DYZ95_07255 [Apilactobacillus timberlakei]|nr:hypothetical protein DYZ95_07255 [Apilactobacillus timberlakei]
MFHINYLDDPRITPFHNKDAFSAVAGMTDDWWFNLMVIGLGFALLISVLANKHKSSSLFFMISIFFLILISFAFSIRTIEQHYNITWLISLILVLIAIHTPREDGGKK